MKKILFIVGAIVVLILLLMWPWRIRVNREVVIRASLFDVGPQLTDLANWKHWYPDAARHTFNCMANNPAGVVVKVDNGTYLSLMAMPEKNISYTRVSATGVVSLMDWIKGDREVIKRGLNSLKLFLENPETHYGFDIGIQLVTDTLLMTKRDTVAPALVAGRLDTLRNQLMDYLAKNQDLPMLYDVYTINERVGNNRVLIAVGIPIAHVPPAQKGMELLRLPVNGRFLVGRYKDSLSAVGDLRRAMDKFVQDQHLTKAALPLTKNHALYYPVY